MQTNKSRLMSGHFYFAVSFKGRLLNPIGVTLWVLPLISASH